MTAPTDSQPQYAPRSAKPVEPWTIIAADRGTCPVAFNPDLQAVALLRAEDVREAAKSAKTFVNRHGTARVPAATEMELSAQVLSFADAPRHGRQRRLLIAALSAARVEERKLRIQEIADEQVAKLKAGGGTFELIKDFARPFPGAVLAEVLGVPDKDRDFFVRGAQLSEASLAYASAADVPWKDELLAWADYIRELVKETRTAEPTENLISTLCFAEIDGDQFSDDEVTSMVKLLLQAGNTTTTSLIGNAAWAMDQNPAQKAAFLADVDGTVANVVEETLRFDGPLHGLYRMTVEDTEIDGCPISAGTPIWLGFGAGSHDPEVYDNPDNYDISRDWAEIQGHLGFGLGPHFCAGANLARAEASTALATLYSQLPGLRVKAGFVPDQLPTATFRSWMSLEMEFDV